VNVVTQLPLDLLLFSLSADAHMFFRDYYAIKPIYYLMESQDETP